MPLNEPARGSLRNEFQSVAQNGNPMQHGVDRSCQAWNFFADDKVASMTFRDWAQVWHGASRLLGPSHLATASSHWAHKQAPITGLDRQSHRTRNQKLSFPQCNRRNIRERPDPASASHSRLVAMEPSSKRTQFEHRLRAH